MNEQVRHAENGIALVVAHIYVHDRAVLLGDDAVHGERERDPLIVLDAAVVVRVEKCEAVALVEWILLQIEAGAVDVRAQDVHAFAQGISSQLHQDERLAVGMRPHLVARGKRAPLADGVGERDVARFLSHADGGCGATPLGLVLRNEVDVVAGQAFEGLEVHFVVLLPSYFVFHVLRPFVLSKAYRDAANYSARRPHLGGCERSANCGGECEEATCIRFGNSV